MFRYHYYCSQCGFSEACATKDDFSATRSTHKQDGCKLTQAPHKGHLILTRAEVAAEAWGGMDKMLAAQKKEQELNEIDENNIIDG